MILGRYFKPFIVPFLPHIYGLAPLALAGISAGASLLPRLLGAIGKGKRDRQTQQQLETAAETFQTPDATTEATNVARGVANAGDPTANLRQQLIDQQAANTLGTAQNVSGSTQEIINAAQGIQAQQNQATLQNQGQAAQYRLNAQQFLANALGRQGSQELQTDLLNQRAIEAEAGRIAQDRQIRQDNITGAGSDIASSFLLATQLGGGGNAG